MMLAARMLLLPLLAAVCFSSINEAWSTRAASIVGEWCLLFDDVGQAGVLQC